MPKHPHSILCCTSTFSPPEPCPKPQAAPYWTPTWSGDSARSPLHTLPKLPVSSPLSHVSCQPHCGKFKGVDDGQRQRTSSSTCSCIAGESSPGPHSSIWTRQPLLESILGVFEGRVGGGGGGGGGGCRGGEGKGVRWCQRDRGSEARSDAKHVAESVLDTELFKFLPSSSKCVCMEGSRRNTTQQTSKKKSPQALIELNMSVRHLAKVQGRWCIHQNTT